MSPEAADFFNAEIARQRARLARIEAKAHTSGLFARQRWLEACCRVIRCDWASLRKAAFDRETAELGAQHAKAKTNPG